GNVFVLTRLLLSQPDILLGGSLFFLGLDFLILGNPFHLPEKLAGALFELALQFGRFVQLGLLGTRELVARAAPGRIKVLGLLAEPPLLCEAGRCCALDRIAASPRALVGGPGVLWCF